MRNLHGWSCIPQPSIMKSPLKCYREKSIIDLECGPAQPSLFLVVLPTLKLAKQPLTPLIAMKITESFSLIEMARLVGMPREQRTEKKNRKLIFNICHFTFLEYSCVCFLCLALL